MQARRIAVACVLALGFWQLGQGAYLPAKAWLAQELLQRAWRETQDGAPRTRPWPWADTWPVARLKTLGGDRELIVLAGATGRTLAFGPGHLSASALPGERGTSVIAGHRDTHFRFLESLAVGEDLVVQRADGGETRYRIFDTDVVDATRARLVLDDRRTLLTLVTCYPFDALRAGGPLRYVVSAERVAAPRAAAAPPRRLHP